MTISELTDMMDEIVLEDRKDPALFRPIVAIGHTKDLGDLETVESFLSYLKEKGIAVTTFGGAYLRCQQ
jgi:Fe-S oxidoreductase